MTWFRVDDVLTFHPRVQRAGNAAMGLWLRAGTWCAEHLTDGWIAHEDARVIGSAAEIKKLVAVGLWTEEERAGEKGYQFHRWSTNGVGDKRQPTRAEVEERRRLDRERKARGGRSTAAQRAESAGLPDGIRVESDGTPPAPVPSRPVPSQELPPAEGEPTAAGPRSSRAGATRIPEPFLLTRDMRQWAADETPNVDVDRATREFVDFWRGASRDATKKDWLAVWRNRMRKLQEPHDQARTLPVKKNRDERALDVIAMGKRLADKQRGEIGT